MDPLPAWHTTLEQIRESGKKLSAANRSILAEIRAGAEKLSTRPDAVKLVELADSLLALDAAAVEESTRIAESVELSWEEVEARVRAAVADANLTLDEYGDRRYGWAYVMATYADRVIYRKQEKTYECGYTLADDGTVALGESREVVQTFEPLAESVHILEATKGSTSGREWDVLLIEVGTSKNGVHYSADVLEAAAPLYEGAAAFADHDTDEEARQRPERSIREKVGTFRDVKFGKWSIGGRTVEGLRATFKVIAPWLREILTEAMAAGEPDFLGLSHNVIADWTPAKVGGKAVKKVTKVHEAKSVDVVTDPSAGGRMVKLVASNRPPAEKGKTTVDPDEIKRLAAEAATAAVGAAIRTALPDAIKEAVAASAAAAQPDHEDASEIKKALAELKESNRLAAQTTRVTAALADSTLSDTGKGQLRKRLLESVERRDLTEDEIAASVAEQVAYEASFLQESANPRHAGAGRVAAGDDRGDKLDKALQGFFKGEDVDGVKRFRSLKEGYCRWNGIDLFDEFDTLEFADSFGVKYDSHRSHKKVRESLTRSSWGEVFADNLYTQMLTEYREPSVYSSWKKFVSHFEDVEDFQTRHWTRVGGYGDLATVAEQATYPTLTSPTDEEVTYSLAKHGGLDDASLEALVDGRSNRMRMIPLGMARAARRTLYKFIMDLITTTNPTMAYDATALYHSDHANTGTTALSIAGLDTTQVAMRDQTAYNESAEILGDRNKIKFVIVPNELEGRIRRILDPSDAYQFALSSTPDADTSMDPARFKGLGMEHHVYDQLTDANDWWAVADPKEVETIIVGFLNGNREPELFVQDNPLVGSNFTADKVTWKVRFIYGAVVAEHRSFYRQVVS